MKKLLVLLACLSGIAFADNGHGLWLNNSAAPQKVAVSIKGDKSETMEIARQELLNAWHGGKVSLEVSLEVSSFKFQVSSEAGSGNKPETRNLKPETRNLKPETRNLKPETRNLKPETFTISAKSGKVTISSPSAIGVLYGTYHLLRMQSCGENVTDTVLSESPVFPLRILNHWDNLDGTIERGYAGPSIFWTDAAEQPQLIKDYARANASVGINASVLNNVNASPKVLSSEYLQKIKGFADIMRPYGVKVYLSVNFASPMALGATKTADPLEADVQKWWREKCDEIYSLIPDFGGFLVKANSEGQPGPNDYHRSHSEGANMLARALKPHNGVVMWRSFVYAANDPDRAKQAYQEFKPLDGEFDDNVIIQIKNGPVDFQPREPFSPLFGALDKTREMVELQITQEYLGHSNHVAYLATMWEEFYGDVAPSNLVAAAGVANIGRDINWCGNVMAQSNWYAFGRQSWNPAISSETIANEWVKQTLAPTTQDAQETIVAMMMRSREAVVDYMMPMGLHHQFADNHHYGPGPWIHHKNLRLDWQPPYYHKADSLGLGFDRTSKTGTNAVSQYPADWAKQLDDIKTCPEKFLLWFHHVPWDYMMGNETMWSRLCHHYQHGVNEVRDMQRQWKSVAGTVDTEIYDEITKKLEIQLKDAVWWKDGCLDYFQTLSKMPYPADVEPSIHNLEDLKKVNLGLGVFGCPSGELLDKWRGDTVVIAPARGLPFKDPNLSFEERTEDLLSRLTLDQKIRLMIDDNRAIPELGIQRYNWWNEALHGAARSGVATIFPQAIGMAASFDDVLLQDVFDIAGTEQRIKYIEARAKNNVARYKGLTVWTPNINIFRDPRWGRGQETYGEDPYLTLRMGRAVVLGLQGDPDAKYDKLHACLKHYAVHSGPESNRHEFDAHDISLRDLAETYLYAFERIVKTTDVQEVMCAYNAFEGEPCCGSDNLLTQILRNEWGYKGLIVSDCGAINDFWRETRSHQLHFSDEMKAKNADAGLASANAVLAGTDVECGSSYLSLKSAVERGAITEADLDVSVRRLLLARFRLGEMEDDDSLVSWNHIDPNTLASDESDAVALKMAQESMVLLQNNGVLPLARDNKKGKTIAVVGPNANDSIVLWGNYNGTSRGSVTVLEGIKAKLGPKDKLIYIPGSELVERNSIDSRFNDCSTAAGKGLSAEFWNDTPQRKNQPWSMPTGKPDATTQFTAPFMLTTGGNTVFAPGIELLNFSATFKTTYHAKATEDIVFRIEAKGLGEIWVDGKKLGNMKNKSVLGEQKFHAEAGKDYEIELRFSPSSHNALFTFDLGVLAPVDVDDIARQVAKADVVVYVGGISASLEGEEMSVKYEGFNGGDRTAIALPAVQRETLAALKRAGKKVVFVNMSGSAIGLEPETKTCDAILQAWYGGQQGGTAVADVLFGDYNPSGRLPLTFYKSENDLPHFEDYNMKGKTYRYFDGTPVFYFGHGLSYSTFEYGEAKISSKEGLSSREMYRVGEKLQLSIPVTNTSSVDGTEVVQVYVKHNSDVDGPIKTLRAFQRVSIPAGKTVDVNFTLDAQTFATFSDETAKLEDLPGTYTIFYGKSADPKDLQELKVVRN